MDFDRQEAYDHRALREEREDSPREEPPMQTQFSLRALLLLAVPVAILSLMFRWMMRNGYAGAVCKAGIMGVVLGVTIAITLGGLSYLLGSKDDSRRFLRSWSWFCLSSAFYGGLGSACLVAILCWAARIISA